MSGKLHELLAVEGDLAGVYTSIVSETNTNFKKHPERYFGQHVRVELFDVDAPKESDLHKELDDTVKNKLDYTSDHIIRYLDAVLQKEKTNQIAFGDIEVDGVKIASNVPATFLLGLETKLKKIKNDVYLSIPTLQPGIKWEDDSSHEKKGVYKRVLPIDEKFRTKKIRKNHVVAVATKEHPEQVEVYTEDEKVARIVTDTWCGMLSPSEKSALIGRVDKLIMAVKKGRQKANYTEIVEATIGKELFNYINGEL